MHLQPKTHFIGDYVFFSCKEFHSLIFASLASLGSMIFGHHPWFLLIFTPPINRKDKILQLLKSWTQLFAVLMVTSLVEGTTAHKLCHCSVMW